MSNEIQPFFGKEREVRTAQEHLFGSRGRLLLMLCLALTLLGSLVNAAPVSSHVDAYSTQDENPRYWITASSGKTHNSSCRYYKKSKGHGSDTPSGKDCKVCGGASKS